MRRMAILSVFLFVIVAGTRLLDSPIVMIPKLLIGSAATVIAATGPGEVSLHLGLETRPQNLSALSEEELAQWANSRKPSTQESPTLHDISSLRCTFETRITSQRWEPGSVPELDVGKDSQPLQFFVDSIDRENRKARIIGNAGSADLVVIPSSKIMHLIERTPTGGFNLLTIESQLSDDGSSSSFRAVYSRHPTALFGHWIVAQYYGVCQMWE